MLKNEINKNLNYIFKTCESQCDFIFILIQISHFKIIEIL